MNKKSDGLVLLRLASQVEDLLARVAELEGHRSTDSATLHRHTQAIEVFSDILSNLPGDDEDDEQDATLQ